MQMEYIFIVCTHFKLGFNYIHLNSLINYNIQLFKSPHSEYHDEG